LLLYLLKTTSMVVGKGFGDGLGYLAGVGIGTAGLV
jgi:hypothetical protein